MKEGQNHWLSSSRNISSLLSSSSITPMPFSPPNTAAACCTAVEIVHCFWLKQYSLKSAIDSLRFMATSILSIFPLRLWLNSLKSGIAGTRKCIFKFHGVSSRHLEEFDIAAGCRKLVRKVQYGTGEYPPLLKSKEVTIILYPASSIPYSEKLLLYNVIQIILH